MSVLDETECASERVKRLSYAVHSRDPNTKTTVRPKGAATRLKAGKRLVAEGAKILNREELRTLHRREWTKCRVRKPVIHAREALRAEQVIPHASVIRFGMF